MKSNEKLMNLSLRMPFLLLSKKEGEGPSARESSDTVSLSTDALKGDVVPSLLVLGGEVLYFHRGWGED